MKITSPPRRYPPVGRCIYCGASNGDLRREHIIPFGLGGNLILPSSSCRSCEKITGRAEQICLKGIFGKFRTKTKLPTRQPKDRKSTIDLEIFERASDVHPVMRSVTVDEYPVSLGLMRFSQFPGAILGEPPSDQLRIEGVWSAIETGYPIKGHALGLGTIKVTEFCLMLAKIAHSFVIAEKGIGIIDNYEPLLPDLILGKKQYIGYVIGGRPKLHQAPELGAIHKLSVLNDREDKHIGAAIRLFASLGAPQYYVAFGLKRRTRQTSLLSSKSDSTAFIPKKRNNSFPH